MIAQSLADGILTGAIIALGAIGVSLGLQILRFANIAHAELLTWDAYLALVFVTYASAGTSIAPRYPTMVASGKFVATPMAEGVRCAGVIEFGGLAAGKSQRPLDLIRSRLKDAFPTLTFATCDEWLGHRPAPSDSIPLIGPVPGHPGVFLAFGHHHVGLTSGPKTGRLLATMMQGEAAELDMAPYAPARFVRTSTP